MAETGASVDVHPVHGRGDLAAFIKLPWEIYRNDPQWVPPLLYEVRKVLDRSRHPFHAHADVEYFLARRQGRVVGRIAAFVNHRFNEFHDLRAGHFGFFECTDDVEAARALLDMAREWCRQRGMEVLQGPFNFSTNDELYSPGVLVDGFHHPPVMLMAHTPPYYSRLLEDCGFVKARDLLSFWIEGEVPPERLLRGVAHMKARHNVVVRPLDLRRFKEEIGRIKEIYHSAWERNWGFVPMTDPEFDYLAKSLRPVVDPRFCALAEIEGEPVAFGLQLPDLNRAMKSMNGRLLPVGWLKFLLRRGRIDALRVLTLGVKPAHRHKGLDAMLILHLFTEGLKKGFRGAECSWILEDNLPMRRGLERIGARAYKTYRVYEKALEGES
jgi:GNAT superfamily N-acetyltransferase